MTDEKTTGTVWSNQEIDLIVAEYFEMLRMELIRESYVKAHRNKALQEQIGRSHKSIEFKHQNISAVLQELGEPWIPGYKPKAHFQKALLDGVERYLDKFGRQFIMSSEKTNKGVGEDYSILFNGPPPMEFPLSDNDNFELVRLVRKFDPAARDARNRDLGRRGEERVFKSERARLSATGREDLARKVRWVAQEDGDGAGYDILSFQEEGDERFLEVKTTAGHARTPFYLSANERAFSEERPDAFRIFRLYDFAREPKAFSIKPPLEDRLCLEAVSYRASFG